MRLSFSLVAVISLILLGGCSSTGRSVRVDPAVIVTRSSLIAPSDAKENSGTANTGSQCDLVAPYQGDKKMAINLDCFRFKSDDRRTAYRMALSEKVARDKLSFVLLSQADLICELEKGGLYGNRATTNVALDLASSGFAITSTIVGGNQAKSILSGISGLSTATRTNIDSNIYQNQLVSAITKVMDAERKSILDIIRSRQTQTLEQYTADEMIFLVNQYHQACSFQKGVQLLLDAAVNKEGVDRIVKAMNLRQAISEAERNSEALKRLGLLPDTAEQKALAEAIAAAALQLAKIGETSQSVTISPPE